jgi:hypothetical protein
MVELLEQLSIDGIDTIYRFCRGGSSQAQLAMPDHRGACQTCGGQSQV